MDIYDLSIFLAQKNTCRKLKKYSPMYSRHKANKKSQLTFFEFKVDSSKLQSFKGGRGEFIKNHKRNLTVDKSSMMRHGNLPL